MKVAIGPVFTETDGPSQHILAIKKYSSHKVYDIPTRKTRSILKGTTEEGIRGRRLRSYQHWVEKSHFLNLYDVVHSHIWAWFMEQCLKARSRTTKWVHTYHTMYFEEDYPEGFTDWHREVNRALLEVAPNADLRISASKWFHDLLLEKYTIETTVINNAYDSQACENADAKRFSDRFGLRDFVLFAGHYGPVKNPDYFIRLASKIEEVTFVMMGQNVEEHIVRKDYNALPENLHILGPQSHETVLDAMAAASVFVMTSKREGFPTAMLEAMGLGKPVVGPNHTGCEEVIGSKEYGFLYEPESFDSLVENVHGALESKNIGDRGRERARDNFSWEVIIKRIDAEYEKLFE